MRHQATVWVTVTVTAGAVVIELVTESPSLPLWVAVALFGAFMWSRCYNHRWIRELFQKSKAHDMEPEPEWEVIAYHGDTEQPKSALADSMEQFERMLRRAYGLKEEQKPRRFPHTVKNKRTGEIRTIPHPGEKQ